MSSKPRSTAKFKTLFPLLVVALAGWHPSALAAPCCSANAAAPALISGDDRAQVSLIAGNTSIIGDAPAEGIAVWRSSDNDERTQTLSLDGAFLVGDRWQLGVGTSFVRHSLAHLGDATTALGDIRLDGAYELVPEWSYSTWTPKAYVFAQLILPTGKSIYEADLPGGVDAAGRGFYTLAVGTLLLKRWSDIDAYVLPEIHYSAARVFSDPSTGEPFTVSPGWGGSFALGVGYSPGGGNLRLGARVQPMYGGPKRVASTVGENMTAYQLSWDTALEAGYLVADNWSVSASYTDQTLLGPAVNTALGRSLSVSVQHRWPR